MPAYGSPGVTSSSGSAPTGAVTETLGEVKDETLDRVGDVKDKTSEAAHEATQAVGDVAHSAAEAVQEVAEEAAKQARDLVSEAKSQMSEQVKDQHEKLVTGLRALSDQLATMARSGEQSGLASELVSQAQSRVHDVAGWLDGRAPGDLVGEARAFARRRPGAFLLGAALAGVVAGRMTRGVAAAHTDDVGESAAVAPGQPKPSAAPSVTERGAPFGGVSLPPPASGAMGYSSPPTPSGGEGVPAT
ncbi:MAG: hypothetical protein M3O28_03070, partial [Actinomycetota bacterium]|nr:hypothetical protein [Actinomycetota bacterium]